MKVIPAIDLKNGNCVRLLQGDPERETVYSHNPADMAKKFEDKGAELIHVVDLDGAFQGKPVNADAVIEISRAVGIPIEIGGGIRTTSDIKRYLDAGIKRIILGTVLMNDEFLELVEPFIDYIVAGVDAKNSIVATHGWKMLSEMNSIDLIKELFRSGLREFIYTDIATDGMLTGPNYQYIEEIIARIKGIVLIASGGVSSLDDIVKLSRYAPLGLKGCIVGKAIYDGKIDLAEAIAKAKGRVE